MSHPTTAPPAPPVPGESPGTAGPGSATPAAPAPPAQASDVTRQIADLTDAVNRLVQAQSARVAAQPAPNVPAAPDAPVDIGGDFPGGAPLAAAVDYAKLSPVQQIALGLRDARHVGPTTRTTPARRDVAPPDDDKPPVGAD